MCPRPWGPARSSSSGERVPGLGRFAQSRLRLQWASECASRPTSSILLTVWPLAFDLAILDLGRLEGIAPGVLAVAHAHPDGLAARLLRNAGDRGDGAVLRHAGKAE